MRRRLFSSFIILLRPWVLKTEIAITSRSIRSFEDCWSIIWKIFRRYRHL